MNEQISELCISILHNTSDGDDLSSNDLSFVENAVNGNLNPLGEVKLYQLDYDIKNNQYEIPWFCGVENLTRGKGDDRSVFWRGKRIEHYDHDFWCSKGWQKDMKKDAERLGKICRYLEDNGIKVNFDNYVKYGKKLR